MSITREWAIANGAQHAHMHPRMEPKRARMHPLGLIHRNIDGTSYAPRGRAESGDERTPPASLIGAAPLHSYRLPRLSLGQLNEARWGSKRFTYGGAL